MYEKSMDKRVKRGGSTQQTSKCLLCTMMVTSCSTVMQVWNGMSRSRQSTFINSSRHVTIQVQPFLVPAKVCNVYMCCSHLATHTCTWKDEYAPASLCFTNCMHVAACFFNVCIFAQARKMFMLRCSSQAVKCSVVCMFTASYSNMYNTCIRYCNNTLPGGVQ